jgi:hypothetical protein
MENRNKQDGIRVLYQLVNQYETDGNRSVRIKKLENVITTVFHLNYKRALNKWIQDYEDAFKELVLLGQKTWNDDNINKRQDKIHKCCEIGGRTPSSNVYEFTQETYYDK